MVKGRHEQGTKPHNIVVLYGNHKYLSMTPEFKTISLLYLNMMDYNYKSTNCTYPAT